ncbi:hypothetical protein pdam_00015904 [Pocillopora damicornis]|uniref:Uncharacterized protein n=1 Tax=Pocillopora damicornis TaxID=46731 RepID=A0A3M6UWC1_POCDA|nr:hypothetical protein pdam_00015904 [Pocillopora damicornis]
MNHWHGKAASPHLWIHKIGDEQRHRYSSDHEISNGQVDEKVMSMLATRFCFDERSNGDTIRQDDHKGYDTERSPPENSFNAGHSSRCSSLGRCRVVHHSWPRRQL